jgi:GR25 family glycosyltransferase involved in LPS biosynthesis
MDDDKVSLGLILQIKENTRSTLEQITSKTEKETTLYCCLLSEQLSGKPSHAITLLTLNALDDSIQKLAELYLLKAAYIYNEHINQAYIQKTDEEYFQESCCVNQLIEVASSLNPAIRLKREHRIARHETLCQDKEVQTAGYLIELGFPKNIIEMINESINGILVFKKLDQKFGITE